MSDVYDLDFDYEDEAEEPAVAPLPGKKSKAAHVWERGEFDWYIEPERVTDALARVESFIGPTLDPCCGGGNIVRALRRADVNAWGSDVVLRKGMEEHDRFRGVHDFLAEPDAIPGRWANVVMNPPFFKAVGAEAFIRRALEVATAKVAAFLDVKFLASEGRASGLYRELPPSRIYIISPRVSCPPGEHIEGGGKVGGGVPDWCWIVWDKTFPRGGTALHWLDVGPPPPRAPRAQKARSS